MTSVEKVHPRQPEDTEQQVLCSRLRNLGCSSAILPRQDQEQGLGQDPMPRRESGRQAPYLLSRKVISLYPSRVD